ncbi:sialic acid-binding Ig-like lectin 15 [Scleropages formosus]|uniref:sialic acid-binding Ig-like lectin 15 n=1 Tax=Scleropages formosus TaxID=113540 RepID=UPI000878C5CF|nr:sialic acid-binding Ig-like lectin 15 [Scleropages formosus]
MDSTHLYTLLLLLLHTAGGHDEGWQVKVPPEVRAIENYPVVLPCSFTHPQHSHHSSMLVQWRLGHGPGATMLFQCTVHNESHHCQSHQHQDQRYRLEGDPRQHDLSLRISSTALQDSGLYYCRVEPQGRAHSGFENKRGLRLRVEAPPQILGVWVESSGESGYRAVCRVRGSPLPDVQWSRTEERLESSRLSPLPQEAQHHTSSLLEDVLPEQHYTCTASNPLGEDQATLYLLHPSPAQLYLGPQRVLVLLSLSLGAKVILCLCWATWLLFEGGLSWLNCKTQ